MEKTSPIKKSKKEPTSIQKEPKIEKPKKEKSAKSVAKTKETKEIKENVLKEKVDRYFRATGRRKTAVAIVCLFTQGEKTFLVNDKPYEKYFSTKDLQGKILSPLEIMNCIDRFKVLIKVKGGGLNAQAEAARHGISRALMLFNPTFRKRLKKAGFLTRDARMRERKKFGLKRARRAPQWSKR